MVVGGVSRAATGARPMRRQAGARAFPVDGERPGRVETAVEVAGVAMTSLLAVQEAEWGAKQDQQAQRHGEAMIGELAALQQALLAEGEPNLEGLSRLAGRPVVAADPALAGLMRAIQLRAGIELARRGHAASV